MPESNEFFYLDDAGNKQDANLHNAILSPVDNPIDEKIMAPIRAKYRAEHVNQHSAPGRAKRWAKAKAKAETILARDWGRWLKLRHHAQARLVKGHNGL